MTLKVNYGYFSGVSSGIAGNGWALAKAAWEPLDFCKNFSAAFANALLLAGGIFSTKL